MRSKTVTGLLANRRRLISVVVIILAVAGIGIGFNLWYQNFRYVSTDNARITAALVSVTTTTTWQIVALDVDIGSYVNRGQRVAEVGRPRVSNSADPIGRTGIEAPVSGFVAAVWTYPGAIVNPGQPIVTLFDASEVWVSANISEVEIDRIHPGQQVEIRVDSLGGTTLKGTVQGVAAATSATFSLLPQQNTASNFIKVAQVVPVKIAIENPQDYQLIPGTSVEVTIVTR